MSGKVRVKNYIGFVILSILIGLCVAGCAKKDTGSDTAILETKEAAGNDKLSLRMQGIAYMGAGDYAAAERSFQAALKTSNGIVKKVDIDISYYLGVCEFKLGKFNEAIDTFSAIIGIDEKAEDAYYMRGKVELVKGDKSAALSDYDRAVELKPSKYTLYQKIYIDLYDAGYESEAGAYIGRAVDANEKMGDYQRGVFAYYMGNFDEARNYLEKARSSKKEEARLIIYLGRCYDALGDTDYAASLYQSYLEGNAADATMYNELGLIRLKLSDNEGALAAFQKGIELNDENAMQSLRFNEIVAYERLSDFSRAKTSMAAYLNDYPSDKTAQREYEFLKSR